MNLGWVIALDTFLSKGARRLISMNIAPADPKGRWDANHCVLSNHTERIINAAARFLANMTFNHHWTRMIRMFSRPLFVYVSIATAI